MKQIRVKIQEDGKLLLTLDRTKISSCCAHTCQKVHTLFNMLQDLQTHQHKLHLEITMS